MRRIPKNIYHIILFPAVLIYFELLLKILGGTGNFSYLVYPFLFSVGAGLFFAALTSAFYMKTNRIISQVVLVVLGVIFTVECLIYRNMQYYMPIGGISSVADDVVSGYSQTLFQTIFASVPIIALFLLPAVLYLVYGARYVPAERQMPKMSGFLLAGAAVITGIGVLLAGSGEIRDKYKSQYKFDTAVQSFGLISGLELDSVYGLFGNDAADELVITLEADPKESSEVEDPLAEPSVTPEVTEIVYEKNEMDLPLDEISEAAKDETLVSMNEYVKSIPSSSQNEYTGLFKGKNLILICAEAFSHKAVHPELTPTLYRLMHNGFYFSDYYQSYWGGSTSTGEYSMLMGIAPLRDIRTLPETENKNLYFTMGNQLQRLGYTGNAFHNGSHTYYSRHLTHENLGYDDYLAFGSGLEDISSRWCGDAEMFETTLATYIDKQPFSVYYMTGSGHFPYEADSAKAAKHMEHVRNIVGDQYKDTTLAYLSCQMELEYGLAAVVQQLEDAGIADDTVICITSDHYPYGLKKSSTYGNGQDYLGDLYGAYPEHVWDRDQNGWILWSGSLENEDKDMACEVAEPTYSLDILPTLSNLFGLEYDSRLLAGRDVFSETEALVLWTDHSWVTEEGTYDGDTGTFYPNEGSQVGEDYVERINTIVTNKLSFSGKIHSYDYYDILFGEKG